MPGKHRHRPPPPTLTIEPIGDDEFRMKVATALLDACRPPPGFQGAEPRLTDSRLLGFGMALSTLLHAAVIAPNTGVRPEERRALLVQGFAMAQAELLANAPEALRGRIAATLMLMAIEEAERLESHIDVPTAGAA